jgi:hypothetical protein
VILVAADVIEAITSTAGTTAAKILVSAVVLDTLTTNDTLLANVLVLAV